MITNIQYPLPGELGQQHQVHDTVGDRAGHLRRHRLPAEADRLREGPVQLHPPPPDEERVEVNKKKK